jgi:hypothetical protein
MPRAHHLPVASPLDCWQKFVSRYNQAIAPFQQLEQA